MITTGLTNAVIAEVNSLHTTGNHISSTDFVNSYTVGATFGYFNSLIFPNLATPLAPGVALSDKFVNVYLASKLSLVSGSMAGLTVLAWELLGGADINSSFRKYISTMLKSFFKFGQKNKKHNLIVDVIVGEVINEDKQVC